MSEWKCWRDLAHKAVVRHPVFGWPQCAICRAAPAYYERWKHLPDDLLLDIYVPDWGSTLFAKGSAILGVRVDDGEHMSILVHYEGWIYGQKAMVPPRQAWMDGLKNAAGRMCVEYPTVARATVSEKSLVRIGFYNPKAHQVTIENEPALSAWLEEA